MSFLLLPSKSRNLGEAKFALFSHPSLPQFGPSIIKVINEFSFSKDKSSK
jgi:hypothetical protein